MALTKEQILAADDIARESVNVPEWSGDVWVASMSAAARDKFDGFLVTRDLNDASSRAMLVSLCLVDDSGALMFSADELARKSYAALDRIVPVAMRLNGLGKQAQADIEKN